MSQFIKNLLSQQQQAFVLKKIINNHKINIVKSKNFATQAYSIQKHLPSISSKHLSLLLNHSFNRLNSQYVKLNMAKALVIGADGSESSELVRRQQNQSSGNATSSTNTTWLPNHTTTSNNTGSISASKAPDIVEGIENPNLLTKCVELLFLVALTLTVLKCYINEKKTDSTNLNNHNTNNNKNPSSHNDDYYSQSQIQQQQCHSSSYSSSSSNISYVDDNVTIDDINNNFLHLLKNNP